MSEEIIKAVASDLRFLAGTWGTRVDDDTLRRGSTQLRLLLVDGLLQRAWKLAGFEREPITKSPHLEPFLKINPNLVYGIAGGGNYEGVQGAFAFMNAGSTPAAEPPNPEPNYAFGLRRFIESCSIFADGLRISRREVVKYVANKLGGAHLDRNRKEPESVALSKVETQFKFADKNAVYFELLSIGQALAGSHSIQQFLTRVG